MASTVDPSKLNRVVCQQGVIAVKIKFSAEIELSGITGYDLANVLIGIVEAVHKSAGYRGV